MKVNGDLRAGREAYGEPDGADNLRDVHTKKERSCPAFQFIHFRQITEPQLQGIFSESSSKSNL